MRPSAAGAHLGLASVQRTRHNRGTLSQRPCRMTGLDPMQPFGAAAMKCSGYHS
jgi:hypothetical protein